MTESKTIEYVHLCLYRHRNWTTVTLGDQGIAGPDLTPYGQPDITYRVPIRQLREIIASAERSGDPE